MPVHARRALLLLLSLAVAGPAPGASLSAHDAVARIAGERAAWPSGVSSNLRQLFATAARRGSTAAAVAGTIGVRSAGGKVLVDVILAGDENGLVQRIESLGGTVHAFSWRHRRATVAVADVDALAAIAALPQVHHVYPEYGPIRRRSGSVSSRAVEALNVDALAPGNTGAGQTIGILSDSFARTDSVVDTDTEKDGAQIETSATSTPVDLTRSAPQDTGDLPASLVLRSDDARPPLSDEGAAMAELAFDLAPNAGIVFHTAFGGFADFAAGIDDLCGPAGATVVVDDVGYPAELMYQRDIISRAAEDCVTAGVPYFSAAGNNGDVAFRQRFLDLTPATDDSGRASVLPLAATDLHDWGGGDAFLRVDVPAGATATAVLQWNQPARSVPENNERGPQIDLDLFALDGATLAATVTHSSFQDQLASDPADGADPVEIIRIDNSGGVGTLTRYVVIDHWAGSQEDIPQDDGTALEFRLVFFGLGSGDVRVVQPGTNNPWGPAMYGHPIADGVVSVGAVPWWEAPAFDPTLGPTTGIDPEAFTARGGSIHQHFRPDGSFFRRTHDPQPRLAAVDGNNNTFFGQNNATPMIDGEDDGSPNFFGTSAAAPNAAAIAALLKSASPTLDPAGIAAKLSTSAVDVDGRNAAAGCDDRTGPGLVDSGAALAAFDRAPVARAGDDRNARAGRSVSLDGSTSSDNRAIDRFRWTQVAGPRVSLINPNGAQTGFTAPNRNGTLVFELRVTDAACLSDADRVRIEVGGAGGGGSVGWLLVVLLPLLWWRKLRRSPLAGPARLGHNQTPAAGPNPSRPGGTAAMKMLIGRTLAVVIALPLLAAAPSANADIGIGARAGTLGLGVDVSYGFTPLFNFRVGLNRFDHDFDFDTDNGSYDAELELNSIHALLDFHPWGGGFRITGGLLSNDNQIDANGTVGGASVDARIDFDSSAPYAGIGWGNATRGFLPISWSLDLGIVAQGSPNVTIRSSGLSNAQERQEEQDLEDELDSFDTYPVISAGLIFRF